MNIPIVTLDKIYITPDEENIYFLDCTRVGGTNAIISRKSESLEDQIKRISNSITSNKIILADDVIFSGSVLKKIIAMFKLQNIEVVGLICAICAASSYEYFNSTLPYGVKGNYLLSNDVVDEVCERDFYFGIAGSGIMQENKNIVAKAPYFLPFGNPCANASIPKEYEKDFSLGCIDRSVYLWNQIDKQKLNPTLIRELPEKIVETNENDEVVMTLKRKRRNI